MSDQRLSKLKILSIVGQTATGKTGLSLKLAKKLFADQHFSGINLISADSRQVYQELKIISGADVPAEFSQKKSLNFSQPFFQHKNLSINLHGVGILKAEDEWSVAHFRNLAIEIIKKSWQQNWLPIIVGGTGLYHLHIFNNDPDIYVKPNEKLRAEAEKSSVEKLQKQVKQADEGRWRAMNHSDQHNPRRLIRSLEISQTLQNPPAHIKNRPQIQSPQKKLTLGLTLPNEILENLIEKRVEERLQNDALTEAHNLFQQNLPVSSPILSSTGLSSIKKYLDKKIDKKQLIQTWTLEELQYAKRQLTWFKKRPDIQWFQANEEKLTTQVWRLVKKSLLN